jgi:hypothetical protein
MAADFGSFMPKVGQSYTQDSGGGWSSPQQSQAAPSQPQAQGYGGQPRNWGFPAMGGGRGGPQWGGYGGQGMRPGYGRMPMGGGMTSPAQNQLGQPPVAGTAIAAPQMSGDPGGGGAAQGGMNPTVQMLLSKMHEVLPGAYGQGPALAQNALAQPPSYGGGMVTGTAVPMNWNLPGTVNRFQPQMSGGDPFNFRNSTGQ